MEELHEILTNWVRKLSNSEVHDERPKEMWITREKVTVYQESGAYANLMTPNGFLCDEPADKIQLPNNFQIATESANLLGNLSLKDSRKATDDLVPELELDARGNQSKRKKEHKQPKKIAYKDNPRKKIKLQSKEGFSTYVCVPSEQQREVEAIMPKMEEFPEIEASSSQFMDDFPRDPIDEDRLRSGMSFEQEIEEKPSDIDLSVQVFQNETSDKEQLLEEFSPWSSPLEVKRESSVHTPIEPAEDHSLHIGSEEPLRNQSGPMVIKEEQQEEGEMDDLSFDINLQKETRENYFDNDETEPAEDTPYKDGVSEKEGVEVEEGEDLLKQGDEKSDFDFEIDTQNGSDGREGDLPTPFNDLDKEGSTNDRKNERVGSQEEKKNLTLSFEDEGEQNDFDSVEFSVDNSFYLDDSKKKSLPRVHGVLDQGDLVSIDADQLTL